MAGPEHRQVCLTNHVAFEPVTGDVGSDSDERLVLLRQENDESDRASMPIELSLSDSDRIAVLTLAGRIDIPDIQWMRTETMNVVRRTGITDWVVDLRDVTEIVGQQVGKLYEVGDNFRDLEFPMSTRTAIIEPTHESAREDARLIHLVETNRGRAPMKYVDSIEEARAWFST